MQNAVTIVVLIVGGIAAGVLLRRRERWVRAADGAALGAVFLLLFLLGLDLGSRQEVVRSLGSVGLEAGMISTAAMLGSLAVTWVVHLVWFRRDGHED